MLNENRKLVLTSLLDHEPHDVPMEKYISIKRLSGTSDDKAFYSLLAQAGYLSILHLYLLGMLSAFRDVTRSYPLSNRESGNGRYDICVERRGFRIIFELKVCEGVEDLDKKAQEASEQIDIKRFGVELAPEKKLVKVGIAFHKKSCRVRVGG